MKNIKNLDAEQLKKQCIETLDQVHSKFGFQKKAFAVIIALFLEDKPLSEDQIMELTNCARSTVSTLLKLYIHQRMVKIIKYAGDRKKYWTPAIDFTDYWNDYLKFIIGTYKSNIDFIPNHIKALKSISKENSEIEHYWEFLVDFYKLNYIFIGIFDYILEKPQNQTISDEISKIIEEKHKQAEIFLKSFEAKPINSIDLEKEIISFVNDLATTIEPTGSSRDLAKISSLLLAKQNGLTQEEISEILKISRGTVSETLNILTQLGFIKAEKHQTSKKLIYSNACTMVDLVIKKFDGLIGFCTQIIQISKNFEEKFKDIDLITAYEFMNRFSDTYNNFAKMIELIKKKYEEHFKKNLKISSFESIQ